MKITIGGLPGTGTSTIGKRLAKSLGYKFVSGGDLFRKAAEKHGMTMEEFDAYSNKNLEVRVDDEIDSIQKKMGKDEDDFVLESRLAWYLVPDAIKIKLDAEEDERIKRITEDTEANRIAYKKDSFEETRRKTIERAKVHQERIFDIYGIEDMMADENFDFVLDTTNLNFDQVFEKVLEYVQEQNK